MGTQLHEPSAMTFLEAPIMEKWLLWFHALQQDVAQLKSADTHSLAEWSVLLREFATRYVAPLDSHQERDQLFQRLEVLESLLCPALNPNDAVFLSLASSHVWSGCYNKRRLCAMKGNPVLLLWPP